MQPAAKFGAWLLVALAVAASPAFARGGGRGHDHGQRGHHQGKGWHDNGRHGDRHGTVVYGAGYPVYGAPVYRAPAYRYYGPARYEVRRAPLPRYVPGYGAAYYGRTYYYGPAPIPAPRWTRGVRYYDDGYGPTYVITDYRAYGLRYPPYGYGWRRDDYGHYLLVALATGVIVDLILHGGY